MNSAKKSFVVSQTSDCWNIGISFKDENEAINHHVRSDNVKKGEEFYIGVIKDGVMKVVDIRKIIVEENILKISKGMPNG